MNDGRVLRHREHINRGASDRPIVREDVVSKYLDNAGMAIARARAERIHEAVFGAENLSGRALEAVLAE